MQRPKYSRNLEQRTGALTVEVALVISVFMTLVAGIVEFGHVYLVINTLNAASKQATRIGSAEQSTTQDALDRIDQIIAAGFRCEPSEVTVWVKDASIFDQPGGPPASIDYESLPDIELADAQTNQLFLIRIQVNYSDVALMPPFWSDDLVLIGQSAARHE
ncbi:MAG: TadE/TadG family type IV pilus assembly protein [Planctomycetaceae bacterium]